jgi:prepilin-type N-terminal cleavage/methylation domain-containing protein
MPRTTARTPRPSPRHARPAFTMIELLIVIGIIGVLVGLTLVVGKQVMSGGKQKATQETLRVLTAAMDDYIAVKGDVPPPVYVGGTTAAPIWYPMADAIDPSTNTMINSVGLFMEQMRTVPSARRLLDNLPQSSVRIFDADGTGPQPAVMTVFDAWNRPIRFVHPAFQGVYVTPVPTTESMWPLPTRAPVPTYAITSVRRQNVTVDDTYKPDADGGMCVGNRPYFYSVGEDGLSGVKKDTGTPAKVTEDFNKDNVYSLPPNFTDKM